MRDVALVVGCAVVAVGAICLAQDTPLFVAAVCAAVLAALLVRWHELRDWVGLAIGATVGNVLELTCAAAGVWIHARPAVLGIAPLYILICYPILGVALPRVAEALAGSRRTVRDVVGETGWIALALLAGVIALSWWAGRSTAAMLVVTGTFCALAWWQFHGRHDLAAAVAGLSLAFVWEIPATMTEAWRFPDPDVFGLVPAWLPLAYAGFFITIDRLTAVAADRADLFLRRRPWPRWTPERAADLRYVSMLIAGAVAGVCLTFPRPLLCAAISGAVLLAALARWHTRADVLVAIVGAIAGPTLEYFATGAGLWRYPYPSVGLLPAWVFTLWPAFPVCLVRLTETLWPSRGRAARPPIVQASTGLAILAIEIPLITALGNTRPGTTTVITALMLVATVWVLRSPQATLMLTLSGVFGMLCESLPIAIGAWSYPQPVLLGMPAWLPAGYSLFGLGIVQLAHGIHGLRQADADVDQRRAEQAVASG